MQTALTSAPVLRTERLILRGPERTDLAPFTAYMTGSARLAEQGETIAADQAWYGFMTGIGHWQWHGFGFFTLTLHGDTAPLGRAGLLKHAGWPQVELAWHLFDAAEGHGYATEAARVVRDWAWTQHGIAQLVSYIDRTNHRSQAVARRLGAESDGTRAPHEPEAKIWHHPVMG